MSRKEYDFINGVKLDINMGDVDFVDKYETAFTEAREKEKTLPKVGKTSEIMLAELRLYDELIDKIFGPGTAQKLFGDTKDCVARRDVVFQIISICKKQMDEIQSKNRSFLERKYTPTGK